MTDPADAFTWSFLPNWGQSFRVTREYRSDIFVSRSRRESRRALRTTPRRKFSFEALLDGADFREFGAIMAGAQNKPFIMPDWSRRSALSAAAALGANSVTLASVPAWIVAGRALFLFDGRARPTAVFVDSIAGGVVTLTAPLAAAWGAGTTVLPGAVGLLGDQVRQSNPTSSVGTINVDFSVEPGSEPLETPPAPEVTFNGREVCLLRPNWSGGIDQTVEWPNEQIDYQRGLTAIFFPFDFMSNVRRASFIAASPAEARAIEQLQDRMLGQRGEFYMPTDINDLPPVAALAGSTLVVAGTHVDTYYSGSKVFKAICVLLRDGTRLYRTVTGIGTSGGNSLLTVGATWPTTIAVADVRKISWMPVWRFASDSLTMDWKTSGVATCDINLRTLEDLPAETA